ncbi:hypothetical protein TNCV_93351 [Trichonephila clavipes]|nr:hypothetical protein TNCV_93351 [Trichonephila clavipes]
MIEVHLERIFVMRVYPIAFEVIQSNRSRDMMEERKDLEIAMIKEMLKRHYNKHIVQRLHRINPGMEQFCDLITHPLIKQNRSFRFKGRRARFTGTME